MFSGIIRSLGKVVSFSKIDSDKKKGFRFTLEVPWRKVSRGESIAVDGVCLTVIEKKRKKSRLRLTLDVAEETARKTTLSDLTAGKTVNVEWPLKVGDTLGGHLLQGHVDGVGKILKISPQGNSKLYWFSYPGFLRTYLVPKGSIAVDGISLTIVNVRNGGFSCAILPYTEIKTSLGRKKPGDKVNLEADVVLKAVMSKLKWLRKYWKR